MKLDLELETEYQEFKTSLSELDDGLEAMTAMLNKHCMADVYYGVKDNGEIIGLNDQIGKETLKKIENRIVELVKPAVFPTISFENYGDKCIAHISVKGNKRPYSCKGNYRIRIGSANKQVDPDLLGEIFYSSQVSSLESFESINQFLTFNKLKGYYMLRGLTIDNDNFYSNINLLVNGKFNMLAELLADENNTSIKVVRFEGTDKQKMISRNEYGYKCLLTSMIEAKEYVLTLNETRVDIESNLERKEWKLFDTHAFEEAWTNACLHNKWVRNVPPAIYIYSDRIEIVSTGGLPFDYSKEDFYNGISNPINIGLLKIMGQLGLVEQTGHGNLVIIKKYGKEAFDIQNSHITVTIPFAFTPSNVCSVCYKDILFPTQEKVLKAIRNNPFFTKEELSKLCGVGTTTITTTIMELKEMGRLVRVGGKKGGYWKVF